MSKPHLGPTPSPIQWVPVSLSRRKAPGRDVYHLSPYNAEVTKWWNYSYSNYTRSWSEQEKQKPPESFWKLRGKCRISNICGVWSQRIHGYLTHYALLDPCRKVNVRFLSSAVSCVRYFYWDIPQKYRSQIYPAYIYIYIYIYCFVNIREQSKQRINSCKFCRWHKLAFLWMCYKFTAFWVDGFYHAVYWFRGILRQELAEGFQPRWN